MQQFRAFPFWSFLDSFFWRDGRFYLDIPTRLNSQETSVASVAARQTLPKSKSLNIDGNDEQRESVNFRFVELCLVVIVWRVLSIFAIHC